MLGAVAMILAGCSTGTSAVKSPESNDPAGLEQFYAQKLTWKACEGSYLCATAKVPLDYSDPGGRTIEIAMLKVPARGERIGTLFVNPGGPGGSGISLAKNSGMQISASVRQSYDIVGFDPRGVGKSQPVDCLDDQTLGKKLDADFDLTTDAGKQAENQAVSEIVAGCSIKSGDILPFVGTVNAARDLDVLRAVVGDKMFNYLGYSYGTELGAQYAELFPGKVGRMVLDGAVNTQISAAQMSYDQTIGFETAFSHYAAYCVEQQCALGSDVRQIQQRMRGMFDSALASPVPTSDPERPVTRSMLTTAVVGLLYDDATWPYLTNALEDLAAGKGDTVKTFADLINSREGATFKDNSTEANWAINCADLAVSSSEEYAEKSAQLTVEAPVFGTFQTAGTDMCAQWQANARGKGVGPFRAKGSQPIVVIGTKYDPATPYSWAEALSSSLDNGVLVGWEGEGHTAYGRTSSCIRKAVDGYLLDGTVPQNGLYCTD